MKPDKKSCRILRAQERIETQFWSRVRRDVKAALAAIARGDVVDGPAFMRGTIARLSHAVSPR
jgi:hypothetical protein